MRWLAISFVVVVLMVSAVSIVSGGILSGSPTPGGFEARWSTGLSPSQPASTGPHMCRVGRADNSAAYSTLTSTGTQSWIQNCHECDCDSLTGVNNHDCSSSLGTCTLCPSTCSGSNPGALDCSSSLLECEHTGGLCDGTYNCYCDDGIGGSCTGTQCHPTSGDNRQRERTCTGSSTCGWTSYSCNVGSCGAVCNAGQTQSCSNVCHNGNVWSRSQTCQTGCTWGSCSLSAQIETCAPCHQCSSGECTYLCASNQVCDGGVCVIPCPSCAGQANQGVSRYTCSCGACVFSGDPTDTC